MANRAQAEEQLLHKHTQNNSATLVCFQIQKRQLFCYVFFVHCATFGSGCLNLDAKAIQSGGRAIFVSWIPFGCCHHFHFRDVTVMRPVSNRSATQKRASTQILGSILKPLLLCARWYCTKCRGLPVRHDNVESRTDETANVRNDRRNMRPIS